MAKINDIEKQVKSNIVDLKEDLARQVEKTTDEIKGAEQDISEVLKEKSRDALGEGRSYVHNIEEKTKSHPLAALGIAAGIGLLIGLLV